MSVRQIIKTEKQTGVSTYSDAFILPTRAQQVSVACVETSGGEIAVGAQVEISIDSESEVKAGTNNWIPSEMGNHTSHGIEHILPPVTAVRLRVSDGTWTFSVNTL